MERLKVYFQGEKEDWSEGRVVITKTHTFRPEDHPLTDAVMLIRNPYDCFLSEFNRITSGSDHTGKASNAGKTVRILFELGCRSTACRGFILI